MAYEAGSTIEFQNFRALRVVTIISALTGIPNPLRGLPGEQHVYHTRFGAIMAMAAALPKFLMEMEVALLFAKRVSTAAQRSSQNPGQKAAGQQAVSLISTASHCMP